MIYNKALSNVFGPKKEESSEKFGHEHNEEHRHPKVSPSTYLTIKSTTVRTMDRFPIGL
jgi:hypothetical protein